MLDESGHDILAAREPLPADAPELCSAEFRSTGDLRLAVNRAGSLVCYFRSPAQSLTANDVTIEVEGRAAAAHTISALGDGIWQANVMPQHPLVGGAAVRIRLGEGEWSLTSPASEKR